MIQRNHVMSAHRLSDVRHGQLLGRFSLSSCTPRIACCGHHVNEHRRTKVPVGRCAGSSTELSAMFAHSSLLPVSDAHRRSMIDQLGSHSFPVAALFLRVAISASALVPYKSFFL